MGAQLRVYRRRIRSVQSTKKITKAMELIAASRIAKAQAQKSDNPAEDTEPAGGSGDAEK
jgi:F-type H+-transporting ATPase subunit gamma